MSSGERDRDGGSGDGEERSIRASLDEGDDAGATTLALRTYGPEILRYLTTLLGDATDAKDAFSLFGERVWRGVGTYRGESSVRTWMFRVAWSAASDLRKDRYRQRGRRLETGEGADLPEAGGGHRTRTWQRRERWALVLERLRGHLTLEEQCLLQLRIDKGLPWEACAIVLAGEGPPVPVPTLRKRFERLKARLRELLGEDERADGSPTSR